MNDVVLIAGGLIFFAVFLAVEGLYIWWNSSRGPDAKRMAKRLRMMSAGGHIDSSVSSVLKQRLLSNSPGLEGLLLRLPRVTSIDRFIVQSGSEWTVGSFLGFTIGLFFSGLLVGLVLRFPPAVALVIGFVLAILPLQYLIYLRNKRLKRFDQLLPEALDLIGRALRAGHAFPSALQMAGTELPDPVGEELRQTFDEINFGVDTASALENLAGRVPSVDLGFFVIAVLIQRETGGNLSEVLDNISSIIRERLKLFGKVRALSAEGKFSAITLSILPFATAFLLYLINPEFMSLLWTEPVGVYLIAGGVTFMILGSLWMRKIIQIRV